MSGTRRKRHVRFTDGAGFTRHRWECANATDWDGEDGRAWHVEGISLGRWTKWAEGYVVHAMGDSGQWHYLMPEWLTHTHPDSLESIADELDELVDAADSADDGSEMLANFADRIRRLAEKEEQR